METVAIQIQIKNKFAIFVQARATHHQSSLFGDLVSFQVEVISGRVCEFDTGIMVNTAKDQVRPENYTKI